MSGIIFPASWAVLKHPHVRWELLAELRELSDPLETSRWLGPDSGQARGIGQTVHFFFDDHDFDSGAIGSVLFDESEVQLIKTLTAAMDRVIGSGRSSISDRDALGHPAWSQVEDAAREALGVLQTRGVPRFEEGSP